MAKDKEHEGKFELSRRDFLKAGAAAAVVGASGADMVFTASRAAATDVAHTYTTTCPYCSAQCGQKVAVDADNNVIDIYGDPNNPNNRGGLCAKGAGSFQLVNNPRRLGVPEHTTGVDDIAFANGDFRGTAWFRDGDDAWSEIPLATAMSEIATQLVTLRGDVTPGLTSDSNSPHVQFLGSSHINNEQNYLYRKIIANFGTSLVEHQARI